MPSFPERESSILAVLKKKKPGRVPETETQENSSPQPSPINHQNSHVNNHTNVRDVKNYKKLKIYYPLTINFSV